MTDSVLIVGGGVAGLHAAMQCADAGARAIVVERGAVIGGKLAATMTAATAIGDRAEGVETPLFETLEKNDKIEVITLGQLENLEGRPGNFTATIRERARFVTDACTRCKLCRAVCPVVQPNAHDAGLTYRKAIYTPMGETYPEAYVIDIADCLNTPPNYLPCQRCVEVCDDEAIDFHLPLDRIHERHVGAVIVAPGFQIESSDNFSGIGYGKHPDILTSAELQRLLESPGPTGGFASKPSNEEYPGSVLLVLDDPSHFALYIVASQVHQLVEQDVDKVAVLVLSQPHPDGEYEEVQALAAESGVQVSWGGMLKLDPAAENVIDVSYEDFSANRYARETYDMVVLCSDVGPVEGLADLAKAAGIELSETGYIAVSAEDDTCASRPGVFVAGCASGPKNIKDSIATAHAAAGGALASLDPRLLSAEYSPEGAQAAPDAGSDAGRPPVSDDETRARIEQLLYALLGATDAE